MESTDRKWSFAGPMTKGKVWKLLISGTHPKINHYWSLFFCGKLVRKSVITRATKQDNFLCGENCKFQFFETEYVYIFYPHIKNDKKSMLHQFSGCWRLLINFSCPLYSWKLTNHTTSLSGFLLQFISLHFVASYDLDNPLIKSHFVFLSWRYPPSSISSPFQWNCT